MRESRAKSTRESRGQLVCFLHAEFQDRGAIVDDMAVWAFLQDTRFEVGLDDTIAILCDMQERRYIRFERKYNDYLRRWKYSKIELTPAGRDLAERTTVDPAVLIF